MKGVDTVSSLVTDNKTDDDKHKKMDPAVKIT